MLRKLWNLFLACLASVILAACGPERLVVSDPAEAYKKDDQGWKVNKEPSRTGPSQKK